jgi:secondary thiamine-phosphate synthase enzyme
MIKEISIKTHTREELIDITSEVQSAVTSAGIKDGFAICFVPHTTAGITINENADPDVKRDLIYKLNKEFPQSDGYHHAEGNSDAHLKASLFGSSEHILIENGQLVLGTWQGIYFCEFDGPRTRRLKIKVIAGE